MPEIDGEPNDAVPENDTDFEALLGYLKRTRGFDFTGYKRASLMRRVQKRMQTVAVDGFTDYLDYLEVHPDEFGHLFNTILINVTAFFRDPEAWVYLRSTGLPRILASLPPESPIRVWSACCASGEEAYTLAMLLAEELGMEAFRRRVKIYATDIDEEALNQGRLASYTQRQVAGVPHELLEKYFDSGGGHHTILKDLRRAVIFGRHDLIQSAPISRVNLLLCRNALMYFNAEVQAQVLPRLHFALADDGLLMLGKAEMLFTHTDLFAPLELRHRIFTKQPKVSLREQRQTVPTEPQPLPVPQDVRMREMLFDSGPVPQIVVGNNGLVSLVNSRARALFQLKPTDVGRPLQDLEVSYRPIDLRSIIDGIYADGRPYTQRNVQGTMASGLVAFFDVQVTPVQEKGATLATAITFTDITEVKRLQDEVLFTSRELEAAYEELQSTNEELETTNEELQSTNEELETTNEELQSTNEELETTNEELQSMNEELETTNEELQSMNEELQSVNEENRIRGYDLSHANAFLASVLTSLNGGVVVLDRNLSVQVWNQRSEDLWGLRAEEVQDKQFLLLDIGLPVGQLQQPIRDCLNNRSGPHEQTLAARNRRGKDFLCNVICTPLVGPDNEIQGVTLLMEDAETNAA